MFFYLSPVCCASSDELTEIRSALLQDTTDFHVRSLALAFATVCAARHFETFLPTECLAVLECFEPDSGGPTVHKHIFFPSLSLAISLCLCFSPELTMSASDVCVLSLGPAITRPDAIRKSYVSGSESYVSRDLDASESDS